MGGPVGSVAGSGSVPSPPYLSVALTYTPSLYDLISLSIPRKRRKDVVAGAVFMRSDTDLVTDRVDQGLLQHERVSARACTPLRISLASPP
jgi:hypothetical protein